MFDFMTVTEYAAMTGRTRMAVRKMIYGGSLLQTGHRVVPIPSKTGKRTVNRWAIGVPREEIMGLRDKR